MSVYAGVQADYVDVRADNVKDKPEPQKLSRGLAGAVAEQRLFYLSISVMAWAAGDIYLLENMDVKP